MANTPNFSLYKPSRADSGVEVDVSLTDNFVKIDTELKNNKDGLDTHKTDVNAHASDKITHADGSVKTTLDNHEERLTSGEVAQAEHETRISSNETTVADHETRLTGVEGKADAIDNRVTDIETLGLDILAPNLEGRLATVESDVEGFLAPATFDAMDSQSYTFDEYRIGYVDSRLADKVSYPILSGETNVTTKTYPYGHVKRYGAYCDFNKTTGVGTDDTVALRNAVQNSIVNGFTLKLEGLIKITDEISIEQYAGLKIIGDSQRNTMIYQATDNKVILRLKGQLYDLSSFGLGYVNPQPLANTDAIAIASNTCNKSSFDNMYIWNSNQAIGIPTQTGGNFIFSCKFTNITISVYSNIGINLTHQSGSASTGNVFENIYLNNEQPAIGGATIGTAENAISLNSLGEGTFTQINVEWSKLKSAISMNACTSLSFDSIHIEGVEFLSTSRYVFEFIDSKGIMTRGVNFLNNIINTSLWRLGVFYVQGRCYIYVHGFNEIGTVLNGKQLHRGVVNSVNNTTRLYFVNCYITNAYTDNGADVSIFIDETPRLYKGTSFPISGLYQLGDICYNTNPTSGGYIGWACVRAGRSGKVRQNSVWCDDGTYIVPATDNGHVYLVIGNGVNGSSIPTYPTTTGGTVVDGAVTLQEAGTSVLFKTYGLIS